MKRFTNVSNGLRSVTFTDGSTIYLIRGQSYESDLETVRVAKRVKVEDVKPAPVSPKRKPSTKSGESFEEFDSKNTEEQAE